jgi:NAD-dependent dihydropyrimidine dehydrogenase PreA subunit
MQKKTKSVSWSESWFLKVVAAGSSLAAAGASLTWSERMAVSWSGSLIRSCGRFWGRFCCLSSCGSRRCSLLDWLWELIVLPPGTLPVTTTKMQQLAHDGNKPCVIAVPNTCTACALCQSQCWMLCVLCSQVNLMTSSSSVGRQSQAGGTVRQLLMTILLIPAAKSPRILLSAQGLCATASQQSGVCEDFSNTGSC